jgi:hypothetical protein
MGQILISTLSNLSPSGYIKKNRKGQWEMGSRPIPFRKKALTCKYFYDKVYTYNPLEKALNKERARC